MIKVLLLTMGIVNSLVIAVSGIAQAAGDKGSYGVGAETLKYQDEMDAKGITETTFSPNDLNLPRVKNAEGNTVSIFELHIHIRCKTQGYYELIEDTAGLNEGMRKFRFKCQGSPVLSGGHELWNVQKDHKVSCTKRTIQKSAIIKELCERFDSATKI